MCVVYAMKICVSSKVTTVHLLLVKIIINIIEIISCYRKQIFFLGLTSVICPRGWRQGRACEPALHPVEDFKGFLEGG